MWEPLRRFSALKPGARGIFLRAAALLPIISISLRLRGFRSTQSSLQKHLPEVASGFANHPDPEMDGRAALTARMVRSAAYRGLGTPTCLEKSLALWWLLGRQGITSSMRIGTHKLGEKFEAHAWVEYAGISLNEPEESHQHYVAFDQAFPIVDAAKK